MAGKGIIRGMDAVIPHGGLGTDIEVEAGEWIEESPSHPVGLELLKKVNTVKVN